jgi:hypothetical protein
MNSTEYLTTTPPAPGLAQHRACSAGSAHGQLGEGLNYLTEAAQIIDAMSGVMRPRCIGCEADCFARLLEPATPGGAPRVRLAKPCVREMLSILLRYGTELGLLGCLGLRQVLGRMTLTSRKTFAVPGKRPGRKNPACGTSTPQRSLPRGSSEAPAGTVPSRLAWPPNSS